MKLLVTGGLGYVGARIVRAALALGHQVRLSSRRPCSDAAWAEGAETVIHHRDNFGAACDGVDAVVHCAAMNEIACAQDPLGALTVNAGESMLLAKAARAAGVRRFLHMSTAHVYGVLEGVIDESTLPRPRHPYAVAHRTAEDFVQAEGGIAVRLSNALGAPAHAGIDRWTVLVNDLCRQAVTTGRLVLRSSGLQRRDFVSLGDVERAVFLLLGATDQGLFNLGGGGSMTVLSMAELIAERCRATLGFEPPLIRPDPAPGEASPPLEYRCGRLTALGYAPTSELSPDIDATLLFCREAFSS